MSKDSLVSSVAAPELGATDDLLPTHQFASGAISPQQRSPWWQWPVLVVLLVCGIALAMALVYHQRLSDWWRLRGYQPPPIVAQLAAQDTMNSYTRHLFYLNKPQLLSTVASFRQHCPENEDTIVLGCYHSGQNGIFIYNVQDPTLAGVQQVTAAHEVLHAVYARLSPRDRDNLDVLLENYYKHDLHDSRVEAEIKLYQATEPHDVMDEMDSTFGTEIANLPTALNTYYKRIFTNRQAIVAYEQQYQGEFTSRMTTINADDRQLSAIKQTINNKQSSLESELSQLNSERAHLNSLLASGQTNSYNAGVTDYNNEVDTYNQGVTSLQAEIAAYNQQVIARNQIAGQLTTLDDALDTRLTTQNTR